MNAISITVTNKRRIIFFNDALWNGKIIEPNPSSYVNPPFCTNNNLENIRGFKHNKNFFYTKIMLLKLIVYHKKQNWMVAVFDASSLFIFSNNVPGNQRW